MGQAKSAVIQSDCGLADESASQVVNHAISQSLTVRSVTYFLTQLDT